ncbi:MAG: hypothetical protein HY787_00760 [Deltaproteobacteria bacterium]|nr:hypothetical protein [Deltaproteobacteria bacterium]
MNPLKKLILPLGLIAVFWVLFTVWGFSATSTNPTIIKPQPAPKEKTTAPQPAPKEKPAPVVDALATYKKTCGQCHMAFPPEFLPSGSWEKLLESTEKHFEESVEVDNKTKAIILPYLKGKGAEFSKAKIPQKIMLSLEGKTPLRLAEIPYLAKKHRKVKPEDFQRKPIGSFANCGACHRLADEWNFGRRIMIPREESSPRNTP